jgi:hypothetical protein
LGPFAVLRSSVLTVRLVGLIVLALAAFVLIGRPSYPFIDSCWHGLIDVDSIGCLPGLNVTKLKLSRDLLDAYLMATQRRVKKLELGTGS